MNQQRSAASVRDARMRALQDDPEFQAAMAAVDAKNLAAAETSQASMQAKHEAIIKELQADMLRGVESPGPVLREAALQVVTTMRLITITQESWATTLLRGRGFRSADAAAITEVIKGYQDVLADARTTFQILLAHTKIVDTRIAAKSAEKPKVRLVPKAA